MFTDKVDYLMHRGDFTLDKVLVLNGAITRVNNCAGGGVAFLGYDLTLIVESCPETI